MRLEYPPGKTDFQKTMMRRMRIAVPVYSKASTPALASPQPLHCSLIFCLFLLVFSRSRFLFCDATCRTLPFRAVTQLYSQDQHPQLQNVQRDIRSTLTVRMTCALSVKTSSSEATPHGCKRLEWPLMMRMICMISFGHIA